MPIFSCQVTFCMINYETVDMSDTTCRRVGMADEADSKSVVGNHVWVQVPSPAYKKAKIASSLFL